MRLWTRIASALLFVSPLLAQRTDVPRSPRFEVASVKRAVVPDEVLARMRSFPGLCGLPALELSGGRVAVNGGSACGLIRVAYNVADYQVVNIPPEFSSGDVANLFDVDARAEGGTPLPVDAARLALQTLLAERFQLRVHRDVREMPIYALTIAKGGPKWPACQNPSAPSSYAPGRIVSCTPPLPFARFAQFLTRETGRAVLDKTGLTAPATFELHWTPEFAQVQPDSPPSLFTAIQEQLGLKLEPQRGPVDVIVVDRVERPTPN